MWIRKNSEVTVTYKATEDAYLQEHGGLEVEVSDSGWVKSTSLPGTAQVVKVDYEWKFGDEVTPEDHPEGTFSVVDSDGVPWQGIPTVFRAGEKLRLVWLEGKELR